MRTLLFPLLLTALLAGCSKSPAENSRGAAAPALAVQAAPVAAAELPAPIEITGTVRAAQRATLAARVMGTLVEIPVALGQRVAAGELLARISAREMDARLAQARAQLNSASRDLERERSLLAQGASTTDLVRSLEDRHAAAQATVREAETMLGYTEIRAPFAGVITRKFADAGDLAAPGQPLVALDGLGRHEVEAAVPDSRVAPLAPGQRLPVFIAAANRACDGTITEIAAAADAAARAVLIRLALPDGTDARSGQFARVLLPGAPVRTLLVPAAAVGRFGQMERVFVVGPDNRAVLRLVKTGARRGDRVEIVSGLEEGESVLVAPPAALREGQALEVRP